MTTQSSGKHVRAIVASLVVLAFVAGISVGVVGTRMVTPRRQIRSSLDMSDVFEKLRLTPEQRRRADSIVGRSAPRSREVMLELGERLARVADSVDAELRTVLTPEQRVMLDSLRRDSRLLLKRKVMTPDGARVDTLLDTSATRRQPK